MNALSLFNDWLDSDDYFSAAKNCAFTPSVDVKETKDAYVLDMDLPGRDEKEINIELNDKLLTISSVRNNDQKETEQKSESEKTTEKNAHILLRERRRADFERRFTLPDDIDSEKVSAAFENGVLTVKIGRKAKEEPKRIQIKVA